jgi:hypothetical protein
MDVGSVGTDGGVHVFGVPSPCYGERVMATLNEAVRRCKWCRRFTTVATSNVHREACERRLAGLVLAMLARDLVKSQECSEKSPA